MKHVMLSYQWDTQELVKQVYAYLTSKSIPVWMDIKGGIKCNLMKSMSEGVERASIVISFCTEKYQNSTNCQTELKYAITLKIRPLTNFDRFLS